MAKINHNNYIDTISELTLNARKRDALFLVADESHEFPKSLKVDGKPLIPFNSNGYMGIEHHPTLVNRAIRTIEKYGVQFSISRAFIGAEIMSELESELTKIFDGRPLLTYTSTSLAHISFFPSVIRRNDLIILDQQVHFSVQTAAHLCSHSGIKSVMVRHNNMEMLERFIKSNYEKFERLWYMIDGVYSMYGDLPPFEQIDRLMSKYPKLYVYADDAHGVGWTGTLGSGAIFDKLKHQPNFVLSTTMCKGFGAHGGVLVFPNREMKQKVDDFGGPLSYSHPLQPPIIGAALGATEFFLSDELEAAQNSMKEKMAYFQSELDKAELPVVSHPETPIFYIGMGRPRATYNMMNRLMEDGFIACTAIFPAVPMKCSGVRIGLSNARTKQEIGDLVSSIKNNLPKVLDEEKLELKDIHKTFNLEKKVTTEAFLENGSMLEFDVEIYDDIVRIPKDTWNEIMKGKGIFDYEGMIDQQKLFSDNEKEQENYDFYYLLITDRETLKPVIATFLTHGIIKDDMLDPPEISKAIEEKRLLDQYHLSSDHLMMGSPITEGEHLHIDRSHKEWKKALLLAIDQIQKLNLRLKANTLLVRDILATDIELKEIFITEGFVPIQMPNANTTTLNWEDYQDYTRSISANRRSKLKKEVEKFSHLYDCRIEYSPSEEKSLHYYNLFQNITDLNLNINMFPYPKKIFSLLQGQKWEYLELYLKQDIEAEFIEEPIAFVCSYRSGKNYTPLLAGMNYSYLESHGLYKQVLYQVMERAFKLGVDKIHFGLSADEAKRKFGAVAEPKIAFAQITDMFNREVIASMSSATSV